MELTSSCRRALVAGLALTTALTVAGCKKEKASTAVGQTGTPGAAVDLPDNPALTYAPADTAYAFATFKPVPLDYWKRMGDAVGPFWEQIKKTTPQDDEGMRWWKAIGDEIGPSFDAKRLEELGISTSGRVVIYGLGPYPVFRMEIASGDRLFAAVQRIAEKAGHPLGAPTEKDGRRYWIIGEPDISILIVIAKGELVASFAPRATIDQKLGLMLGTEKPAKSLDMAVFRDLAKRDGFSAYGVGYAETKQIVNLVAADAPAPGLTPDCRAAIDGVTAKVPRLAFGYADIGKNEIGGGFVLELTPDVVAEVKKVATSLPGVERLVKEKPVFGMAAAFDLDQARALAPRLAGLLRDLGTRCQDSDLTDAAGEVEKAAGKPLPPFLTGLRGGTAAVFDFAMGPGGPTKIDGYAALRVGDAQALVKELATSLPPVAQLGLTPDGKAKALPAGQIPFPGHVAMVKDGLAVALGANSQAAAEGVLTEKPTPAPLLLFRYDYSRIFDVMTGVIPSMPQQEQAQMEAMRGMMKAFGMATFSISIDDRGAVTWFSIELK